MSREDIQTNIRLPSQLKTALNEEAIGNRRSLSAEIIDRLTKSFIPSGVVDGVLKEFDILDQSSGWNDDQRKANAKKDEAVYAALVKVADVLSADGRTIEDERDLLADVVRLMAKIRGGYYRA